MRNLERLGRKGGFLVQFPCSFANAGSIRDVVVSEADWSRIMSLNVRLSETRHETQHRIVQT